MLDCNAYDLVFLPRYVCDLTRPNSCCLVKNKLMNAAVHLLALACIHIIVKQDHSKLKQLMKAVSFL